MNKRKMGLLVMAYGTPYKIGDIERYYTHILHGKRPSARALSGLTKKYNFIGGVSPLAQITKKQAIDLRNKLNKLQDKLKFSLYIGLKHIEPYIEDAVSQMKKDGIKEAVSLVLTPHYSKFGVHTYNERALKAAEKLGELTIRSIKQWHNVPGFVDYWASELTRVYAAMPDKERNNAVLIVSAHSLPKRFIRDDDPYVEQLKETARLISEKTGIKNYAVGWQGGRNPPEAWLGPNIKVLTRDLFEKSGYKTFVYAPVGFVADHLEILYDIDYECKAVCDGMGTNFYRLKMPNSAPQFIDMLANVCLNHLNLWGEETYAFME